MNQRLLMIFLLIVSVLAVLLSRSWLPTNPTDMVRLASAAPVPVGLLDAPWEGDVRVNDDAGTIGQWHASIAVDPSGNAYAIFDDGRNDNYDIYFSYRPVGGSWGPNVKVSDDVGTAAQQDPSIAVDPSGNAYAVWTDHGNGDRNIYFSYRPVGGSWGPNVKVSDDVGTAIQWAPSIAVDPSGNAYAVWADERNGDWDIYFSYRPVGGSWGPNVKVSDDVGTASQKDPSIAVDPSGNAYAVWEDYWNDNYDVYFSYRPAGGSWGPSIQVSEDVGTSVQGDASITVDPSGNAYAVWTDTRNGNFDIYFSYRPVGGSWGPNIKVNDDTGNIAQAVSSIAVDPSGNAYAVWEDERSDADHDVYFSYRPAGGSWGPNIKVNDDAGTDIEQRGPSIAVDPSGNACALWVDFRNGKPDIYFSYRPAGGQGLSISHIEATQAIQDESNGVPLIEGKPTFVRVYVDCGEGCTSLPSATGVLRGYGPSGELAGSPLSPVNRFIVASHQAWTDQRSELEKTLNFTLPPEWTTGTVTLTAEVRSAGAYDTRCEQVTFQSARPLRVAYVPIHYDPFPFCVWLGPSDPDQSRIASAYQWAQKVYPTARIEYYAWPTMDWGLPLRTLACLGGANLENEKKLNFSLSLQWSLSEGTRPDYVFGWLPDEATRGGAADPSWPDWPGLGLAAHGDDDPTHGSRIFAHEVGHLLGRRHTMISSLQQRTCENPDWEYIQEHPEAADYYDWPYPTAKIQQWGLDGSSFGWLLSRSSALEDPSATYDYMSYCWYWNDDPAWTSPDTFRQIHSQSLGAEATGLGVERLSSSDPCFISSGLVYTDDTAILEPIWVISSTVTPENPPAGTEYCLEAQDASNTALVSQCFDLTFMNYETGEAADVDGFNLMLPYPSEVARIVLKKGTTELAVQPISPNNPVVTVLSPNGSETWAPTGSYNITWNASDADMDPLTYSVMYSPDGSDWIPVGGTVTETQVAVNSAELPGSATARVRVLASDGANTSEDESDDVFTVGRKPPSAYILSPEGGISILPRTPILLHGYGYDLEDGVLGETVLHWSSDRDGSLGSGSQVLVTLSAGQHVMTLAAEDSDGNTATTTVDVYAGTQVFLPMALSDG